MRKITKTELKKIFPNAQNKNIDIFLPFINKYMEEYEINTTERISKFLSQIGHESGELTYTEELASGKAYEMRSDLGNTEMGDGVKFKGRGLIQLTGKYNYKTLSKAFEIDLLSSPELLKEPELATKSACWWWQTKRLNEFSDTKDVKFITKIVNGGTNGLQHRIEIYNRCKEILNG